VLSVVPRLSALSLVPDAAAARIVRADGWHWRAVGARGHALFLDRDPPRFRYARYSGLHLPYIVALVDIDDAAGVRLVSATD
jgi:hypothetical protein